MGHPGLAEIQELMGEMGMGTRPPLSKEQRDLKIDLETASKALLAIHDQLARVKALNEQLIATVTVRKVQGPLEESLLPLEVASRQVLQCYRDCTLMFADLGTVHTEVVQE